MYKDHVAILNATMRADVETFKRGALFAVLSARQQVTMLPEQMAEVEAEGVNAKALFGWKRDSYLWLQENGGALWRDATGAETPEDGLRCMTAMPGLGVIKGAFVLQMIGHDIACLDSRNMHREGRTTKEYIPRKYRGPAYRDRLIARYVAETRGKAQELWDLWCQEQGKFRDMTAEAISQLHVDCIAPGIRPASVVPVPYIGTPAEQEIPW